MENGKKVRASRRKYHYIYKTTCLITNKYYIGMHSTDNLEDGYQGSGTILARSIRRHGRENHQTEILEFLPSRKDLRKREARLINEQLLKDKMCMNLVLGGSGGCTPESQFKRSSAGGKKAAKIIEELKKNPEWVKNKSTNISKGLKKAIEENRFKPPSFEGLSHSKETKQKMSEKAKLRTGNKNSQFGTCWIYNNETKQCIKVKNTEIDSYLADGWTKGRKMKF
jgi:group I intron endonuclease